MQVLGPFGANGRVTMMPIRGDGVGNGVVKQTVEGVKLSDGDWRMSFLCQLGNGLADISVTVHYLIDGESLIE
jgi:hypothetical protein